MGWFDVVAGIATGGLYTIGKAAYQAGNAAESAGNAAEEAGLAVAVIGSTIEAVGEQLVSTLKEAEELFTINRLTPRSEDDLWDEEKSRLNSLKQEKAKVENELKALGVSNPSSFSFNFWDLVTNSEEVIKKFQLLARLAAVNKEIQNIFYQEPGILTNGIYNAKESLERFNTIEQPMIEDILASLDDNLEVSEEILQEIKKLFVSTTKVEISESEQGEALKGRLEAIRVEKQYYNKLLTRKDILTSRMSEVIRVYPESMVEIAMGNIKVPDEKIYAAEILEGHTDAGSVIDTGANEGTIIDNGVNEGHVVDNGGHVIDTGINEGTIIDSNTNPGSILDNVADSIHVKDEAVVIGGVHEGTVNAGTVVMKSSAKRTGAQEAMSVTSEAVNSRKILSAINSVNPGASLRSSSTATAATSASTVAGPYLSPMQPYGARISASLSTKFDGYQRNYDLMKAQKAFYARQSLKLDKQYEKLANKWVEVPGVIPGTLEELHGVLQRVRTEEQPRIDLLLDNMNAEVPGTLEELHRVLQAFRTEEQPRVDLLLDNLNTGVPGTLEELSAVLRKVRTEEQPRIDVLLDNLNANLTESKEAISKANETMESVQKALSLLDTGSKLNTNLIKMGAMAVGGLVVLNLFVGLIVLIRMALGM